MKAIVASIVIASAIIFGVVVIEYKSSSSPDQQSSGAVENVSIENGKQIITVNVRGGYSPQVSNAKANLPTVLRFVTNGVFDCSSSVSIPVLGYRANLPQTGSTDVEVPAQEAGTSIQGTCGMGMYRFRLNFS